MIFTSTNNNKEAVSFRTAALNGLASNKGLYVPTSMPKLDQSFFDSASFGAEEAAKVMRLFTGDDIPVEVLTRILDETLSFDFPLVQLEENKYVLELFHGPTKAFKDVGARFMSRVLAYFKAQDDQKSHVLVATSGDTGAAVANGFLNVEGVQVHILFPKGKVSEYQEKQMTTLGGNIQAIEVEGTFDDCQSLVKQAFSDDNLKKEMSLSSANSINVARFLPQMLYYFHASNSLKNKGLSNVVYSVPSGNFGNLTAGLYANKLGLEVDKFIASTNRNDTFVKYLNSGDYKPKPSVLTFSNAMDVGAPSNFARILDLFDKNWGDINKRIKGKSLTDEETLGAIQQVYADTSYVIDPHGAVGYLGLNEFLSPQQTGVVLGTASPLKFASVIQKVISDFETPVSDQNKIYKERIKNSYESLLEVITA
jgi:threonine synthase